ncbi:DUF177 domain-containing protein [Moraxella sp. ZJ142]|uniref:YceD family protein n=1 Tax=Moraxella marmotae TaxID=3344520 RepID=UPI0035D4634B
MTAISHKHPEKQTLPNHIMLEKWADIGFEWQGDLQIGELPRLAEQTCTDGVLAVAVRLHKVDGIVWLDYQVAGQIQVACQRCLEPLDVDVSGAYSLALLASADDVPLIDDAEYILMQELGNGVTHKLPIKDLLEDELLLTLPLSPRHEDCEMLVESAGDELESEEIHDNPFAALAGLKGKLS